MLDQAGVFLLARIGVSCATRSYCQTTILTLPAEHLCMGWGCQGLARFLQSPGVVGHGALESSWVWARHAPYQGDIGSRLRKPGGSCKRGVFQLGAEGE